MNNNKTQQTSPILLFVYNRPIHTRKVLTALEKADLSNQSDLFIFSDGAKDSNSIHLVNQVRAIICEPWHFKSITIIERKSNLGLAANIIDGVSSIIKKYGRVIVLEDDLEISKYGLRYFNDALTTYQFEDKVMEISGYMYPIKNPSVLDESFFFRVANSWGWATWSRAWNHFDTDINKLTENFSKEDIQRFTIDHTENFWRQVQQFKAGQINSWAIRWYLSIFNKNGLVLYPRESMIQNIGTDGSGTHSDEDSIYTVELADKPITSFPKEIEENKVAYEAIRYFYKKRKGSLVNRAIRYAKKIWKKRNR